MSKNNNNYVGVSTVMEKGLVSRKQSQGHADTSILNTLSESGPSTVQPGRIIYDIDVSDSMGIECEPQYTKLDSAKHALISSFGIAARSMPSYEVALITFNSNAQRVCDFVNIEQGYKQLVQATKNLIHCGGTNIPLALDAAFNLFGANISSKDTLILMSDGCGGDGTAIAKKLKDLGVTIKVVGFSSGSKYDLDELMLKDIASVQEGKILYKFASNKASLTKTFGDFTRVDATKVM